MLRNILLSSAALVALTSASFAADLPNRKAPPAVPYVAAPVFTWTGFYVGAQIGGGWTSDRGRVFSPANVYLGRGDAGASGVVGGLMAGYNWQMNNVVLGVEGDIEATSITRTNRNLFTAAGVLIDGTIAGNGVIRELLPWQGSLRARLGYAAGNALFYATGGLAFAQVDTRYSTTGVLVGGVNSYSTTRAGWTLGAGIEYAFNNNWTARVEYRYTQFGSFSDAPALATNTFWAGNTVRHSLSENAVRVGIAYKFGAPASAVVAKY